MPLRFINQGCEQTLILCCKLWTFAICIMGRLIDPHDCPIVVHLAVVLADDRHRLYARIDLKLTDDIGQFAQVATLDPQASNGSVHHSLLISDYPTAPCT